MSHPNIARHSFARWVAERGKRRAAAILGVSPTAVLQWKNGKMKPDAKHREMIEKVTSIPVAQWDAADGILNTGNVAPPEGPVSNRPAEEVPEILESDGLSAKEKARHHMVNLERRVRDAGNLGVRERAVLDAAYSKAISVYGRMSGELELTTAQILRSPAWGKICNTLVQAVEPWPQAAEAIADALEALEAPAKVDDDA